MAYTLNKPLPSSSASLPDSVGVADADAADAPLKVFRRTVGAWGFVIVVIEVRVLKCIRVPSWWFSWIKHD